MEEKGAEFNSGDGNRFGGLSEPGGEAELSFGESEDEDNERSQYGSKAGEGSYGGNSTQRISADGDGGFGVDDDRGGSELEEAGDDDNGEELGGGNDDMEASLAAIAQKKKKPILALEWEQMWRLYELLSHPKMPWVLQRNDVRRVEELRRSQRWRERDAQRRRRRQQRRKRGPEIATEAAAAGEAEASCSVDSRPKLPGVHRVGDDAEDSEEDEFSYLDDPMPSVKLLRQRHEVDTNCDARQDLNTLLYIMTEWANRIGVDPAPIDESPSHNKATTTANKKKGNSLELFSRRLDKISTKQEMFEEKRVMLIKKHKERERGVGSIETGQTCEDGREPDRHTPRSSESAEQETGEQQVEEGRQTDSTKEASSSSAASVNVELDEMNEDDLDECW